MSTSAWIPRTAALAGLVSLLGAGACGTVATDDSPDAAVQRIDASAADGGEPDGGEPDGGGPASSISVRGSERNTDELVTSLVIPRPQDVTAGDVLLAHLSNTENVAAEVTSADWTVQLDEQSSKRLKSWVLWKVAGDAEPTEYTFEISLQSNVAGIIVAFAGADQVDPIEDADDLVNGTRIEFFTPALTTESSRGRAVWFGAQLLGGSTCPLDPIAPPEGFTHIDDECLSSMQDTGIRFEAATLPLGEPGQQGPWAGSSPNNPQTNIVQVVALRPADESTAADRAASTPAP